MKAACCLLKHGADVTMTDDMGKTPLDLAKGKKMKSTLKEAWTEATLQRRSTNLRPIKKSGSKEDVRMSMEGLPKRKKSTGGEVVFDVSFSFFEEKLSWMYLAFSLARVRINCVLCKLYFPAWKSPV